jgi:hypothetical protein
MPAWPGGIYRASEQSADPCSRTAGHLVRLDGLGHPGEDAVADERVGPAAGGRLLSRLPDG